MKKHAILYDRLFYALHADDKFVAVSDLNHADLIEAIATHLREYFMATGYCASNDGPFWTGMAEAALDTLTCTEQPEW